MSTAFGDVDRLCVNTLRTLAIDTIQKANSGHPGMPLGASPMAYVLWQNHLKHDPASPKWLDRDRFVLSGGHASSMLYCLLHMTGYDVTLEDLQAFRQWGSRTPGHPEMHLTAGVEATTGPLGQGGSNAVGMAIAEAFLAATFNRPGHAIVDHRTYALVSDGDLMEGINAEAASLAGHLKLGKLTFLYDSNRVSLDGPTSITFTEDVGKRYESYGWHVQTVCDGNDDLAAIDAALDAARAETQRPSLVIVNTTIGFGSPNRSGTSKVHGSPLGADELALTKKALGFDPDQTFNVPTTALDHMRAALEKGKAAHAQWHARFDAWRAAFPELAAQWDAAWSLAVPETLTVGLPYYKPGDKVATRVAGGAALNALAEKLPCLLGGDADLSASTQTTLKGKGDFTADNRGGRNLHFGVREHAMGAIANGMACHGGVRPFTATFFAFVDYMRPAVRLAAMNHLPVTFVYTHDSLEVGEDGPTHQPVEQLMSLRCMPGLYTVRPADPNETVAAWCFAVRQTRAPTAIVLTRQNVAALDPGALGAVGDLHRGAYVLSDSPGGKPDAIIIATGSEVALALAAQKLLAGTGVAARVVSMPCCEAFAEQPEGYRNTVLPPSVRARVSVEAGSTHGWHKWIGDAGVAVGIDRYGASAPGPTLMQHYGMTPEAVADAARTSLARCRQ